MERFVYVPKVEVFVRCDGDGSGRIVDLTEDIVDGSVTRNVDAMSTAMITVQNKFGRYTGGAKGSGGPNAVRIRPMDRIIIRMSRVTDPFLVFSGYVDESPKFQLYPGTVTVAASCSLKLIANTYFDPGLPFMRKYFKQFGWTYDPTSGLLYDDVTSGGSNKRFGYLDVAGGIGDVMKHILHDVGNFPTEAIDIDDLPTGFLQSISDAMNKSLTDDQKDTEQALARMRKFLGSTSGASPSTTDPTANPVSGNIAMEDVARYALKAGFKGDNAITATAVAMAESGLKSNALGHNTSDGSYDMGLWQINSVHAGVTPYTQTYSDNPNPPDPTKVIAGLQPFMKQMFTPLLNAEKAYEVASNGTSFTPWVTYNNGAHKPFMVQAQKAVQAAVLSPDAFTTIIDTTISPNSTNDPPRQQTEDQQGSEIATNIVKIAIDESKKGIHEDGSSNSGPEILKYQQVTGAIGQAWCGSFASWVYQQGGLPIVGTKFSNPASVANIMDTARSNGWTTNDPQPADLICWDGPGIEDHVAIITSRSGNNLSYVGGNQSNGVTMGGTTVGALDEIGRTPVYVHVPGVGKAAADAGLGGAGDSGAASTDGSGVADPVAAGLQGGWAVLQTMNNDSTLSILLTGERAMANDISLLSWIGQTCKASGRSFMSKPNGEFFAFFPDYFNYFTKTPYFRISDIELTDFTVYENDTELVTHLFGAAPITSGQVAGLGQITTLDRQESKVASVEADAFKFFVNMDKTFTPYDFLRRYGARPLPQDYPEIGHPVLLWLATWMDFTKQWAKTFRASCSTTFLPELFPGTVVEIGQAGGVTMYVDSVTHSFSREGGFQTDAQLLGLASKTGEPGMVISGNFNDTRFQTSDYLDVNVDLSKAPYNTDPATMANG